MLTRIDRNSIICDDIKTSTGEKYITSDAVFNAQALAETAAVNAIEAANDARNTADTIKANAIEITNEVVSEIKQETFNAQALAETAALEAIDAKSKSVEIKNEFDIYRNNGCVYSGDIILNGSKLLLANGASVELFTGEELPSPGGSGGDSYPLPEEPIDTSDFATLSGDNEFSGNNNFAGNLTLDGKNILTKEDISSLPGKHNVGEQWISMDGIIPMGGLPFLGQSVSRETYSDLFEWIKNNNRFKTEEEWQSLYTSNNGNVSFYGYDGQIGKKSYVDFSDDYYSHLYEGTYFYSYNIEEEEYIFDKDVTLEGIKEYANHISENSNFDVEIIYLENETYAFKFIAKEVGSQFNDIAITHNNDSGGLGESAHVYKYTTEGEDEVLSDTFRLPSFKGYLKANESAGNYTKEGLPNITGTVNITDNVMVNCNPSKIFHPFNGAFHQTTTSSGPRAIGVEAKVETWADGRNIQFSAQKSNSIYGNSTHVTPETNTILVGVYAFNTIINPSNLDVENLRHDISSNAESLRRDISSKKGYVDYTSGIIAHGTSSSLVSNPDPFTAPYDCYVVYNLRWQGGVEASPQIVIFVDNIEVTFYTYIGSTQITTSGGLFLKKGQVLRIEASYVSSYYKYIKIVYYPWN